MAEAAVITSIKIAKNQRNMPSLSVKAEEVNAAITQAMSADAKNVDIEVNIVIRVDACVIVVNSDSSTP